MLLIFKNKSLLEFYQCCLCFLKSKSNEFKQVSSICSYFVSLFWYLPFIGILFCFLFVSTKNESSCCVPSHFIKKFYKINSCLVIHLFFIIFPLHSSHVWDQFELKAFIIENPAKLLDPVLGSYCACNLQYL